MKKINNTSLDRSSLVGEWLLDGNANDTAGTNNGTATNVTWTAASRGYVEEVGSFNGSTSVITTSSPTTTGTSATFSFWLYKTNNVDQAYIVENNYANASHCFFDTATNKINYRFGGTNLISSTANPVVNNTWNFIQIKHEGTTGKIFINTIENASGTVNAKTSSGTGLTFGRLGQLGIYYLNGRMGNIRIHNSITSEGEDKALYKEGLRQFGPTQATTTIPVSGLVASYDYDDITLDTSGNGNDGTASNVITQKVGQQNVGAYNGSSSGIDASITTGANFSVSLSFKATNISLTARLFARGTFGNDLAIQVFQSKVRGLIGQDGSGLVIGTQSATLISGKTYRYILSYDGANLKQYLDGVLITNDATTATIGTGAILSSFGYDTNENKEYFGGQIGLPRIYNRVLTQAEIASLHHEGLTKLSFPNYSLRNLEVGKVLEISNPQSGGSYIDQTGNGNNGTASNVTDSTVGLNNVMGFNSTSSKITVSDTFNINTISFNLRTTDNDNNRMLFSTNNSGQSNYIGQIHTSGFLYSNLGGGSILLPAPTWELNKNYYVTLTTDGAKMSIYIDGVFFASQPTTFSMFYGNIGTGENGYYTGYYFGGELNSINTYQRALSETEIQQDFYSNKIV